MSDDPPDGLPGDPLSAYRALLRAGEIDYDPAQQLAAEKLNLLWRKLARWNPPAAGGLFSRLGLGSKVADAPTGLYLFGGVGRGKSMLMDLFFERAPVAARRRVHFHAFMLDVHRALDDWRRAGRETHTRIGADPIPPVARELAAEARLLCFDEFQVRDPADALILDRLFTELFSLGVVVVATSNVAPAELYADGLNRDRFLPFLDLLQERLEVMELDAGIDYRRGRIDGMEVYFTPAGEAADEALDRAFHALTNGAAVSADCIVLRGRSLPVPAAARGVARFGFADLCEKPLGAADYLAIAGLYHTVVLTGVPVLGPGKRNEAARFVTLIDALYEHRVKLFCSAEAEPDALFIQGDGAFEFARAASRLFEMRSAAYMASPHLT